MTKPATRPPNNNTPRSAQTPPWRPADADIPDVIAKLSLHSLRIELSRRKLRTGGLRRTLETRLAADMARYPPVEPSVHVSLPANTSSAMGVRPVIRRRRRSAAHVLSVPRRFPEECGLYAAYLNKGGVCEVGQGGNGCGGGRGGHDEGEMTRRGGLGARFVGVLRPRSVWIMGQDQILAFWNVHGPCGKANLSRSAPSYNGHERLDVASVKGRALRQLLTLEGKRTQDVHKDKREDDNTEHLQLTLVEAFYCLFVRKCLVVRDGKGGWLQDAGVVWTMFAERDARFPKLFVAYSLYRAAGWLPRSGVKYGVDWVLYPANAKGHAHAPYCIVLRFEPQAADKTRIDRSWSALQNRLRLSKTVAKNLVITNISVTSESDLLTYQDAFRHVRVSEITIDRWLP